MSSHWTHELRNAVNTMTASATVVRMLLEKGDFGRAIEFNEQVLQACERCRELLESAPTDD
jgi:hypothetical protein